LRIVAHGWLKPLFLGSQGHPLRIVHFAT
jgi:hypothetical protein